MKITLITDWTPTEDNFNGPSAHLYHLLLNRPEKEELLVFSTNLNKVTPEMIGVIQNKLCTKVICHKLSFLEKVWRSRRIQYKLDFFRKRPLLSNSYYKIPRKYERQIRSYSPDLIWIYTQSLIGVAKQFSDYNLLITGADCFPLHYSRILRDEYSITNFRYKTEALELVKRINLELEWAKICNVHMHLVGITDEEYFRVISPKVNAKFFPHPHYGLKGNKASLSASKLNILISGKYDQYTFSDTNRLISCLITNNSDFIKNSFCFTFHGKGWSEVCSPLIDLGYNIKFAGWVDDYIDFISGFDIQLFPISVGSGTKGKVLDGLGNGLLCIGSDYAFENIAKSTEDFYVKYTRIEDIISILEDIKNSPKIYEDMVCRAHDVICEFHDGRKILYDILKWCTTGEYNINKDSFYRLPLK